MNISFKIKDGHLILVYQPEDYDIVEYFKEHDSYNIKNTFHVSKSDLFDDELEYCFIIGEVGEKYIKLSSSILDTKHTFYISNEILPRPKMFVATNNISIMRHIDRIVDQDVYVGCGDSNGTYIPIEDFEKLIRIFPTKTELIKYSNNRIALLLKEYFSEVEVHEKEFMKWLQKRSLKDLKLDTQTIPDYHIEFKIQQFTLMKKELEYLLATSSGYTETDWQNRIQKVLLLLFPKYVFLVREVNIPGHHNHFKKPDFLLLDANGFVDILEIKKPEVQIISKNPSYRNNYLPVRELTGIIQQMGVYIHSLNTWGRPGEEKLTKEFEKNLPNKLTVKILNPQGLLLIGRSNDFNEQQKADFEIIKRQYNNITDIMTYDDFLARIDNVLAALADTKQKVIE